MTRAFLFYTGAAPLLRGWPRVHRPNSGPPRPSGTRMTGRLAARLRRCRAPARFFMLTTLCLAIAAGLGVAVLAGDRRLTRIIAAIVCAAAFVDGWIVAMPMGAPPTRCRRAHLAGAHVLELPLDGRQRQRRGDVPRNAPRIAGRQRLRRLRPAAHRRPRLGAEAARSVSADGVAARTSAFTSRIANNPDAHPWTVFMDAQNDAG